MLKCRKCLLTCRLPLPYDHYLPGRVVANLYHIDTAGADVEAQGSVVVALGGQHTAVDVVERHQMPFGALDHYLPAVGIYLGCQHIHVADAFPIVCRILEKKTLSLGNFHKELLYSDNFDMRKVDAFQDVEMVVFGNEKLRPGGNGTVNELVVVRVGLD